MEKILITGSLGLIGFEAALFFLKKGFKVLGIDNQFRKKQFKLKDKYNKKLIFFKRNYKDFYHHYDLDIRNSREMRKIFIKNKSSIKLIIHTAGQTSHDYSAKDVLEDFSINAKATVDLLELTRKYCQEAVFIFTSTNKVYGDRVNFLPLKEFKTRFDLEKDERFYQGIDEDFPIDNSIHSPFGISKTAADLMVQEYGRYFGLQTGVFRLAVIAGGYQSGSFYQGFLSYMINQLKNENVFEIIGYQGKQVRDIIHSYDVAWAFYEFFKNPKKGEVYNLGGGRENAFSIIELIEKIEKLTGEKLKTGYKNKPRLGDHKWWVTNYAKFKRDFPHWRITRGVKDIILDIYNDDLLR